MTKNSQGSRGKIMVQQLGNHSKVGYKTIFNHDIMHCTHDEVVGNYLYSSRALGLTEETDLIQLHPELKSQWSAITNHYDRVGLSHSKNPIWDTCFSQFQNHPNYEPSVFILLNAIADKNKEESIIRDKYQSSFEIVEWINSKNNFIGLAQQLDVKVPETFCCSDKKKFPQSNYIISYPCYLKPAISVDGVGIYRCQNEIELNNALEKIADNIPIQIQQEIIAQSFLNLQYEIIDGVAKPLAATEQILKGYAHAGNRYPSKHQPWELVNPIADWMASRGMKGIFAFDVAVAKTDKDEDTEYYAIECNPRFNGASYPTGIARKLNIDSWSSETFTTKYKSLSEIDLQELEFNPVTGKGIIIVNWGSIKFGKMVILLAGSLTEQDRLRSALEEKLQ